MNTSTSLCTRCRPRHTRQKARGESATEGATQLLEHPWDEVLAREAIGVHGRKRPQVREESRSQGTERLHGAGDGIEKKHVSP
jgi:hypothetical protein